MSKVVYHVQLFFDLLEMFREAKISKESNCIDEKWVIINLSLATSLENA